MGVIVFQDEIVRTEGVVEEEEEEVAAYRSTAHPNQGNLTINIHAYQIHIELIREDDL